MKPPSDDLDPVDPMLEQLLAGELDLSHPTVRNRIQQDPEFAAEAEAMLTLASELGPSPKSVRGEPEPWAGADRAMVEMVQKHAKSVVPIAARRRGWARSVAVAAAAAIAALLFWLRDDPLREPTGPAQLHSSGVFPAGLVRRTELATRPFTWSGRVRSRDDTFQLQFLDETGQPMPAIPPIELRVASFQASAELLGRLPDRFGWQVTARAADGQTEQWAIDVTLQR